MAFLGLMTVREHRAVVKHKDTLFELRGEVVADRDAKIARLEAVCKALRTELATLKAERDGILRDKIAETDRSNKAVSRGLELIREIEALKPDALKYRERLRRDREALAAKRKRAVAALPKAQAARGGDVREGV